MDKIKHLAVIELFVKTGLEPIKIHKEMLNMLGDATPSKTVVCKVVVEFKCGGTRVEDDSCSGRPKKVTTPNIIKKSYTRCWKTSG